MREIMTELYDQRIMSNLARPEYVERMVARLLGDDWVHKGANWSGWDLENSDGVRVEVKQSAARQVWTDRPSLGGRPTKGKFDIAPREGYYSDNGKKYVKAPGRHADLYIFAWHPVVDESVADQRVPSQWKFFVLPRSRLPGRQKSVSLGRLEQWTHAVDARSLRQMVAKEVSSSVPLPERRHRERAGE